MGDVTADPGKTFDADLAAVPFEDLFAVLRRGGGLDDWNAVFSPIIDEVVARLRNRFPYGDTAESAAHSAFRTVLRRVRQDDHDSRLDRIDGPDALIGYVVLMAHHKAWEKIRQRGRPVRLPDDALEDLNPPEADPGTDGDRPDFGPAIRAEMVHQLELLLTRMNLLLRDERQRSVFALLYRKMYGIEKLTYVEIAARTNVADRTVRRVRRKVEEHWPQLVADGRRAIQALVAQLRRAADA